MFSLLESRFDGIKTCIIFCLVNYLFLLEVGGLLLKLLPQIVFLLLEVGSLLLKLLPQIVSLLLELISLLHGDHQFLDIHFKRKSIVSVEHIEEILAKVPSVPSNDGATFVSSPRAEVQLIATHTLQEKNARVYFMTVG